MRQRRRTSHARCNFQLIIGMVGNNYCRHIVCFVYIFRIAAWIEMDKKRFTEEEKNFLLLMIEKQKHIIENKETDGSSLHQKRKAWTEIQSRFNSEPNHTERTVTQLQKCWDNIKTKRKRDLAAAKRQIFGTGGGPSKKSKGDYDDPKIDTIIMNATDIELEDALDSDTVMMLSKASYTSFLSNVSS
ncbi:hypothetical protein ANN_09639 [Periplaneta americana]|uniref:Regulatory protein zeste n=1 Tax=Periplaneta americana TaxID=6978 RepID=A0ABQ8TPH2_PERAM|nr:hypothetical protein ANN_09639 [Periplaneta americana]